MGAMRRSMRLIVCLCPIVLAACATPQKYDAKMDSLIGLTEAQVIKEMKESRLGILMGGSRSPDETYLMFSRNQSVSFYQMFYLQDISDLNCITTFNFRRGKAVSYTHKGDKCLAF
jgi:hypothetical protein